jgi:hypothetical protein
VVKLIGILKIDISLGFKHATGGGFMLVGFGVFSEGELTREG